MVHLDRALTFLESLGIRCTRREVAKGFLIGVRIVEGGLHVDADAAVEDVLHEAGHICVIPPRYRLLANDDLADVEKAMGADLERGCYEIDSPMMRAILQAGDCEATAWAWAAGLDLGIPHKLIVSDRAYEGEGGFVRTQLRLNSYLGINGLQHAGMCSRRGENAYPKMSRWAQTAGSNPEDAYCAHAM